MVIIKVERKGVDEIIKSYQLGGEIDLTFYTIIHLLFQAINISEEESEVVLIVFKRLSIKWQDRILELFLVETLSFVNLTDFFKNKETQEEYKGLDGTRLGINQKFASTIPVPLNTRPLRANNFDVHARQGEGRLRFSNFQGWSHTKQQCRKRSNSIKHGHPSHLCWEKKKGSECCKIV